LRVAYFGGLYPEKGVHVLVDAARRLAHGACTVRIHGVLEWFPDYVARLRAAARGLPVEFAGRFAPDAIDDLLAAADVVCVPSLWYENMPLVVQDAWRNAVPVVASRIGGLAEAVPEGRSGLCFEPGDADDLAACLARLAADRELLFALACARPEPRAFADFCARMVRTYEHALARATPRTVH
jgi:glycosyltransferase involved in cell wall biosynthesis